MEIIPCPDGYLLDAKGPLADGHHLLNQYLVDFEEMGWKAAIKRLNAVRDKPRKLLTWKAVLERLLWLHNNNPASSSMEPFRGLLYEIEKWRLSPVETDLLEILDRTAPVSGFAPPYTPIPHIMAFVETDDLSRELASAIRVFRERLGKNFYKVNQVSVQLFGSRLDMLAWRDPAAAIDLKRCWSEQVRSDFRTLTGDERENWRRVLFSIHGDEGVRPAPRWLNEMQIVIAKIGPENFCEKLLAWFEPLRNGTTQPLSREGSYLLRAFISLAVSTQSPALFAMVNEIREVSFKPTANGQKVIRAAADATQVPV